VFAYVDPVPPRGGSVRAGDRPLAPLALPCEHAGSDWALSATKEEGWSEAVKWIP